MYKKTLKRIGCMALTAILSFMSVGPVLAEECNLGQPDHLEYKSEYTQTGSSYNALSMLPTENAFTYENEPHGEIDDISDNEVPAPLESEDPKEDISGNDAEEESEEDDEGTEPEPEIVEEEPTEEIPANEEEIVGTNPISEGDYEYTTYSELDHTYAVISVYNGSSVNVNIPSTIGGYTVTKIGESAFRNNQSIRTIVMPDTVIEIGNIVFSGCSSLKSIALSKNIQKIGYGVLMNTAISSIYIPKSLSKVGTNGGFSGTGNGTFAGCTNLKTVEFEDGIQTIPDYLFLNCDSLIDIKIPNTVNKIGEFTFRNCDNLKAVYLSKNLETIGQGAFEECTSLTNIEMPDSVIKADNLCFSGCSSLKSITLSKNLQRIGYGVFMNTALYSIKIPKSLSKVDTNGGFSGTGNGTFAGCANLKTIEFENGIQLIPDYLFLNSDSLETIAIPDSVTCIGEFAFRNCDGLTDIILPQSVKTIKNMAFAECNNISICCPAISYAAIYAIENNIPFKQYGSEKPTYKVMQSRNTWYFLQNKNTVKANLSYEISDDYKHITDKKIKIRIPTNTTLTESTLKLNDVICQGYSYDNNTLLIPVNENKGNITFDLNRNDAEILYSYAMLTYKDAGVSDYEIINVLGSIYEGVTINADETVTEKTFNIDGVAPKSSTVEILVDGNSQGATTASKAGRYTYSVTLASPKSEQIYTITAKCAVNGKQYKAETMVEYQEGAPEIKDFRLYYNNKNDGGVNLLDDSKKPYISFAPNVPFTFVVDFDNADSIEKVFVTSTRSNEKRSIEAKYDENSGKYVANGYFDESNHRYVPGTIRVEYQLKHTTRLVQDTIPEDLRNDMSKLSSVLTATTTTTVKKEKNKEEYSFDIGKTLSEVDEKLADVQMDYAISVYDEATDGNLGDFLGMSESMFELTKYVIPGVDDKKYAVALDYSDPTTHTMIIKDLSGAANSFVKYSISLQGEGEWNWMNDIAPALGVISKSAGLVDTVAKNEKAYKSRQEQILESVNIQDKDEALRKNDELRKDQNDFAALMVIYAMLPVAIGLTGPAAIGLTAITGVIGACSGLFWDMRIADMMGKGASINWAIDPSGFVYSQVISNRLENAKVTAFYKEKETDQTSIEWNALEYDQSNPLYTDADGKYAWDVPEGFWMVKSELDGYKTTTTDWMEVPPPRTEVAIRMVPDDVPKLIEITAGSSYVAVIFDQYMDPETITNIALTDSDGKGINYSVDYDKSEVDENGNIYAKEFRLLYTNYVLPESKSLKVSVSNAVKSADGVSVQAEDKDSNKEMEVSVQKNVRVRAGKTGTVRFTVNNYDGKKKFFAISSAPYIVAVNTVTVDEDGKGNISITGGFIGEAVLKVTDGSGRIYGTSKITTIGKDDQLDEDIPVTGIELKPDKSNVVVGETINIAYDIIPSNATDKTLSWISLNPKVATIEEGKVTGIAKGKVVIVAKSNDGTGISQSCSITVNEKGDNSDEEDDEIPENAPEGIWIKGLKSSYMYTGAAIKPGFRVYHGRTILKSGKDYTHTFKNNKKPGTATITIKMKGNYSGSYDKSFKIDKVSLSENIVADTVYVAYKANKTQKVKPALYLNDKKLGANGFTYQYPSTSGNGVPYSDVGNYIIRVLPKDNTYYTGEKIVDLIIVDKPLMSSVKVTPSKSKLPYTGDPVEPTFSLSLKGTPLSNGSDYTVSFNDAHTEIGKHKVTFTGNNKDYFGKKTYTFTITGKYDLESAKASVEFDPASLDPDGNAIHTYGGAKPTVKVRYDGKLLASGKDYTITYKNNRNVAKSVGESAPVAIIKGKGGYKGQVKKYFNIVQRDVNSLSLNIADIAYSAKPDKYLNTSYLFTDENYKKQGMKKDRDFAVSVSGNYGSAPEAGTEIFVTVTGKGNYKGDIKSSYRIIDPAYDFTKASVKVNGGKTYSYTGKPIKPSVSQMSVTIGKDKTTIGSDDFAIVGYYNNVNKGTAYVRLQGRNKYAGIKLVKFKIGAAKDLWSGVVFSLKESFAW